jgi:hypothetical protein
LNELNKQHGAPLGDVLVVVIDGQSAQGFSDLHQPILLVIHLLLVANLAILVLSVLPIPMHYCSLPPQEGVRVIQSVIDLVLSG